MPAQSAGRIVTLTQVGYGLGLLFVIPLADYVENRRLVLTAVGLSALSMLALGHLGGTVLSVVGPGVFCDGKTQAIVRAR
jgi:sugar phosphate permease